MNDDNGVFLIWLASLYLFYQLGRYNEGRWWSKQEWKK